MFLLHYATFVPTILRSYQQLKLPNSSNFWNRLRLFFIGGNKRGKFLNYRGFEVFIDSLKKIKFDVHYFLRVFQNFFRNLLPAAAHGQSQSIALNFIEWDITVYKFSTFG